MLQSALCVMLLIGNNMLLPIAQDNSLLPNQTAMDNLLISVDKPTGLPGGVLRNVPQPTVIDAAPAYSDSVLRMHKADTYYRQAANLAPHELDPRLCQAAQDHAQFVANTGQFDHYSNGNPRLRAMRRGFPVADPNSLYAVRENLAGGFSTPETTVAKWMGTGHREAILEDRPLVGFGDATGPYGRYYVGLYGRDSGATPLPSSEAVGAIGTYSTGIFNACNSGSGGACGVGLRRQAVRSQPLSYAGQQPYSGQGGGGRLKWLRPRSWFGRNR